MLSRVVALAVTLTVPVFSVAEAQLAPSKYDQLQQTLEKQFKPKKQLKSPGAAGTADKKDDFQFVKPKDTAPPAPPAPEKKSSVISWFGSLFSSFGGKPAEPEPAAGAEPAAAPSEAASGDAPASANVFEARMANVDSTKRKRSWRWRPGGPSSAQRPDAAPDVPVAKRNSIVIQLSPSADADAITALLEKYHLVITKTIAPLGVITVEVEEPVAVGASPGPAAAEPAEPADPKQKLQNILEPPLVRDLRDETIVDGAFVNSTLGAKVLPRPAGGKIVIDGETFSWRWRPGADIDGNWGLKAIRMPAVWTILDRYRKAHPGEARPKVGIIDGGFAESASVPFHATFGVKPFPFHTAGCETHHGMHVAGIIGAKQGDTPAIDGMIPDARMDAVAVDDAIVGDSGEVGVDEGWEVHALLFDDVLAKTLNYIYDNMLTPDNLRVINISLGYNFVARDLLGDADPADVPGLALHILHQSNLIRLLASRVEDRVLFVVASGNDSDGRETPLDTRWASPFAWAGTQESAAGERPKNILVVEAIDRDGSRASFSNTGGHVSAPGVDIMSTLAPSGQTLGVCSGTSQAAPHVAALAAILSELDPSKSPAEVADLIRQSAAPAKDGSGAAPVIDALDAVATLSARNLMLAADLDGDGKVGEADMRIFSQKLSAIESAATTNGAFTEDLNGDGVVDDNECYYPAIDFNGSGQGALSIRDARRMAGGSREDVDTLALVWSDPTKPYETALAEHGLARRAGEVIAASAAEHTGLPAQCRRLVASAETVAVIGSQPAAGAGAAATPLASSTTHVAAGDTTPAPDDGAAATDDAAAVKSEVEAAVEDLRAAHPKLKVTINPATGLPSSITGTGPLPGAASLGASSGRGDLTEEETRRAVDAFFGQGGLMAAFPTKNKKATQEYVGRRRDPDFPDRYIAEVEQRVGGVPVFGSSAKLTVDRSLGVTKYTGTTSAVAIDDTTPKITEGDATAAARVKLGELIRSTPDASRALSPPIDPAKVEANATLLVFDPALVGKASTGATRLAWMVSIDSFRIFVDAHTREVFYYYRDRPSGMLRRIYDLDQATAFPGKESIDEGARRRIDVLPSEALQAFRNAGIVRDFYFLIFGRDGYDDNDGDGPAGGGPLEAYVRHGRTQDAFWCITKSYDCPKGNVMVYGPGYASAIDIVGHEMTHGVIVHEKNLLYLNEPGAVNESFADIFGTLIEFEEKGNGGNWLIGEAAPGFSVAAPLRSMAEPNLRDDNGKSMFNRDARFSLSNRGQPDHYSEVLTTQDEQCASTAYQDNGCVHFNSGILNKFAYLVAEGGTHHGISVTGIGRYKLARIAYRAMTAGVNQSSNLTQTATAFTDACYELASGNLAGMASVDCEQVAAAQEAVGLGGVGS